MKKVILFFGRPDPYRDYWWPPINLLFLAASLVSNGYRVKIVDEQITPHYKAELVKAARGAVLVGFTCYTGHQIKGNLKAARLLKKRFPKLPLVWGGSHPSALPEQTIKSRFVDVVVRGQGELALLELAEAFRLERGLGSVKGIVFKEGKATHSIPAREYYDINLIPQLPMYLIDWRKYLNPRTRILNYTSSWGCTNWCTFCYWTGKHFWSGFPAFRVINDLTYLQANGAKTIRMLDSDFFTDKPRALAIAQGILRSGLKLEWFVNTRLSSAMQYSRKDWLLFHKVGLRSVFIGLESGSSELLRAMNKNIELEDMLALSRRLNIIPIKIYLSLMFGLPGETMKDLQATSDFYKQIVAINAMVWRQICIFEPLPGTPLAAIAQKHGFKFPKTLKGWAALGYKSEGFKGRPWFTKEFNKEYKKKLYELFPNSDNYLTQVSRQKK